MQSDTVQRIAEYTPKNGEWTELDELIQDLAKCNLIPEDFPSLFSLFERFPEDDGAEVFWGLVHLLEGVGGFEEALVSSLRHKPSDMATIMVNRMLNGGIDRVGEVRLMDLLAEITWNSNVPGSVSQRAARFIDYQKRKVGTGRGEDS